jgi:glycosyltransferase involved in cell wall biosynthesis
MGKKKVVIIQNVAADHHHVVYLDGFVRKLDRSRFEPVVILQKGADISAHYPPINYQLHLLSGKTYSPIGQLRFMLSCWHAIRREEEIAILHCVNPFSSVVPALLAKMLNKRSPAIIYDRRGLWVEFSVHAGHFSPAMANMIDKFEVGLMKRCDRLIAISPKLKDVLVSKGVPDTQIDIVPGGVDLEKFRNALAFDYKSLGWNGKVLGYIASISTLRNSQDVISAFDIVQRRSTQPVFLAMVGPIYEPEYFESMVKTLGLQDRVKFFGQVPHNQIPGLIKGLDVAISYFPGEDFIFDQVRVPYKVLEYLASGVPMVLTDQLCHRALVQHQYNAYLVEPTVESLAEGMLQLCQDSDLSQRLRQNALHTANRFSFETLARRIEAIYESVIYS